MIDATFIQKICEIYDPKITDMEGRCFSTKPLHPIRMPKPEPVTIMSLTGLVGYIEANIDGLELSQLLVHVESPRKVSLLSALDHEWGCDRARFATAVVLKYLEANEFTGRWMDQETFIIKLKTGFVPADAVVELLKIAGGVRADASIELKDNGVSQSTTVKTGASTVEEITLSKTYILRPYRTFLEVDQPETVYIFRLRKDGSMTLFPTDGGGWELEAMHAIAEWLGDRLSDKVKIIA